jgi:hypothetical protein
VPGGYVILGFAAGTTTETVVRIRDVDSAGGVECNVSGAIKLPNVAARAERDLVGALQVIGTVNLLGRRVVGRRVRGVIDRCSPGRSATGPKSLRRDADDRLNRPLKVRVATDVAGKAVTTGDTTTPPPPPLRKISLLKDLVLFWVIFRHF